VRLEFASADAAKFNAMRDQWRDIAMGANLPKVAHRIASLLHGYVSRELGYAFPTDEQLAEKLNCLVRTVRKGMLALARAGLIERETTFKRSSTNEAGGRNRRIFLALPSDRPTPEVIGPSTVIGPAEVIGPKRVSDRPTVGRISLTYTPDADFAGNDVEVAHSVRMPAREGNAGVYHGDVEFLDAFDQEIIKATSGRQIGAGEIAGIVGQAFDNATASDPMFMPFHWQSVVHGSKQPNRSAALRWKATEDWFHRRAGELFLLRSAA
jgi:hypothetical protein